tara:strand:- start:146 stop:952 length:807 start_codon:yes stop_codon:yes gene_type:complete
MEPKLKKRIHIAPVGFEIDRIVEPAVKYKADKVYLLVHDNKKEDKATRYIESVIKELKENKIQSEKVLVNWRDVESITKAARKLFLELQEDDVFVNIASGSKTHAIALDRAIMSLGDNQKNITEFYAESKSYEGFKPGKKQLSVGVKEIKEIPKRKMVLPEGNLLSALKILYAESITNPHACTFPCYDEHKKTKGKHNWGGMMKSHLADKCADEGIIPSDGNRPSSLDKKITQNLLKKWTYITIAPQGRGFKISLTTDGMAFLYEMTE